MQSSLSIYRGLIPGLLWLLKSMDAQVPYIKWHSTCIQPTHILSYDLSSLDYLLCLMPCKFYVDGCYNALCMKQ
jgi:hypothetical protein